MFVNFTLNTLSFFISLLGFRGIHYVSIVLSYFVFDILRVRRSIMLQNLDIVFGDTKLKSEKINIARNSMASFISTILEFFGAGKLFAKAKINFVNEPIIEKLLSREQGLYAICIHMSNWELLCSVHSKKYSPVNVVVKPIGKGAVAKWVEDLRHSIGYKLIDRKGAITATTQIYNALDNKEVIGFVVDQKRPKGEMLPFFGKIASTNNSLAKLYLRKRAPILPLIIKRKKFDEFEIIYLSEFIMEENPALTFEQQVTENTAKMNLLVEKMILENPNEYFWMHNRWDLKK